MAGAEPAAAGGLMSVLLTTWDGPAPSAAACAAALEEGQVLFFPGLRFDVADQPALFASATASRSKNISFDPATGRLGGTAAEGGLHESLRSAIAEFSRRARQLVEGLLPEYQPSIVTGRASFRPVEVAGRATSWRKDDTRLHVDAFPATPLQGRRILRVFSNVNPSGLPRLWRTGPGFETVAARFVPQLRLPWPGSGRIRSILRLTRSRRSPYDALMLQLHDRMKADDEFQTACLQRRIEFPAGSTWIAFTDAVSHAAMAGQYQFEQTFLVPVTAMRDEQRSPLRILERLEARRLA